MSLIEESRQRQQQLQQTKATQQAELNQLIQQRKQLNQQILTMTRELEALKLRITNEKDFQQVLKRAGM